LPQNDGRAPECDILAGGQGISCVEFHIGAAVADNSVDPATHPQFYQLPRVVAPRITRSFEFNRDNGQWAVNSRFADCNELRFTVTQNTAENFILRNDSGGWQHPIHIHLEHFQTLKRNGGGCPFGGGGAGISAFRPNVPNVEVSRKDTTRLQFNENITLFSRFRDFVGDWPMHCHNTLHEDHAMMLLFQVRPRVVDNNKNP